MSSLIIEPIVINEIIPHPNADRLDLVIIKGWQVVTQKGNYKSGDIGIYIPPDSVVPLELSDRWEVTQYLSKQRVKAIRLRGEMSYGFIAPNENNHPIGVDVAEELGITKWEPAEHVCRGDGERPHVIFTNYTDIENYRNYPDWFTNDDNIVITEKIHGTNSKVGLIFDDENLDGIFMAGSHRTRKKLGNNSTYEKPLTEEMKSLLLNIKEDNPLARAIIAYGEIYGRGVQDLTYGENKSIKYRIFDIKIDEQYMDFSMMKEYCEKHKIEIVPILYIGPYSLERITPLAAGSTTMMDENAHIREGIVFKTLKETNVRDGRRKILKLLNDDYILRKGGTERH